VYRVIRKLSLQLESKRIELQNVTLGVSGCIGQWNVSVQPNSIYAPRGFKLKKKFLFKVCTTTSIFCLIAETRNENFFERVGGKWVGEVLFYWGTSYDRIGVEKIGESTNVLYVQNHFHITLLVWLTFNGFRSPQLTGQVPLFKYDLYFL